MRTIVLMLALGATALVLPAHAAGQNAELVAEGARIYGTQCARCHNLRSPAEFTDLNWRTIIAQMRARANLTRSQARAVLAFVQATNGIGPSSSGPSDDGAAEAAAGASVNRAGTGPRTWPEESALTPPQREALKVYLAKLRSRSDGG